MDRMDLTLLHMQWFFGLTLFFPSFIITIAQLHVSTVLRAGIAQLVQRLAKGWMVRGSNLGGCEIFRTCPDRPWGPPRAPRLKKEQKSTSTPPLGLRGLFQGEIYFLPLLYSGSFLSYLFIKSAYIYFHDPVTYATRILHSAVQKFQD